MPEFTANGVKLVYNVHGDGPAFVLVCGTGQPAVMWNAFGTVDGLVEAGYQVVTFDNRGIPPSDVPEPPYTVEEMADDTIALLDHLGLAPYVMQGSSLGGLITQTVALRRPDLVRAAIFHVGCGNCSAYARVTIPAMLDLIAARERVPESLMLALALPSFVPPSRWNDESFMEMAKVLGAQLVGQFTPGLEGQMHADVKWTSEDHLTELADLRVPALAIAAEFDTGFPPAVIEQAVERMPHGEFVEIKGSAHVSLDPAHGEQLKSAILDFLSRHAPVSTPV